jgi:hypothetical protein
MTEYRSMDAPGQAPSLPDLRLRPDVCGSCEEHPRRRVRRSTGGSALRIVQLCEAKALHA